MANALPWTAALLLLAAFVLLVLRYLGLHVPTPWIAACLVSGVLLGGVAVYVETIFATSE